MELPVISIVGPTAVGKSRLAMEIAAEFSAEIVVADSRQVFRYLDIGTAKPSIRERARVPHHMLDLVDPSETYSAGRYRDEGSRVLRRLAASHTVALVVGGTGFYQRALLDGISLPAVQPNPGFRERLHAEASSEGMGFLFRRLTEADPASAARIHPNNVPRIIRALEVIEMLGAPIPVAGEGTQYPTLRIGLTMDRSHLKEVSDRRVLSQIEAGLVEETYLLLEMGYDPQSPALSGFGYRQVVGYLEGKSSLADAIRDYQVATHQYIRRQMTWFRADSRVIWYDAAVDPLRTVIELVDRWVTGASSQ